MSLGCDNAAMAADGIPTVGVGIEDVVVDGGSCNENADDDGGDDDDVAAVLATLSTITVNGFTPSDLPSPLFNNPSDTIPLSVDAMYSTWGTRTFPSCAVTFPSCVIDFSCAVDLMMGTMGERLTPLSFRIVSETVTVVTDGGTVGGCIDGNNGGDVSVDCDCDGCGIDGGGDGSIGCAAVEV